MTQEFLDSSAKNDANDLSSVVQPGGHWCICAWAFAGTVQRDPSHLQHIKLECDRTNDRLRHVYQHFIDEGKEMESPSGAFYEASTALKFVNKICGSDPEGPEGGETVTPALRKSTPMSIAHTHGGNHKKFRVNGASAATADERANGRPIDIHTKPGN
jgi:hypothetical protein